MQDNWIVKEAEKIDITKDVVILENPDKKNYLDNILIKRFWPVIKESLENTKYDYSPQDTPETDFELSHELSRSLMTQYPECYLARELEICYVNISLITDYDVGLEGHPEIKPVTHEDVIKVFKQNNEKLRELLFKAIPKVPKVRNCICSQALKGATVN